MTLTPPRPTPYPELNAVLLELVTGAQAVLGTDFTGAYLQGSFAVGDFDEFSDVDFLVVVEVRVSEAQWNALQAMHARIHDLPSDWARHLDGSYFPRQLIRHPDPAMTPLPYLDNGSQALVRSDHDNTLVVRWMVRERGVTLAGPEPRQLIEPVPAGQLKDEVRTTMRTWAEELFSSPEKMNNRWYQPFAVLSYCRMLHTLETGVVDSKPAGARWAAGALDASWHGLIQRAWAERPNPPLKYRQPADPAELRSTVEFIRHALKLGVG